MEFCNVDMAISPRDGQELALSDGLKKMGINVLPHYSPLPL